MAGVGDDELVVPYFAIIRRPFQPYEYRVGGYAMAHVKNRQNLLMARVRRIAGQVAAIEKAIADDADCSTVLHQVAGVRGAIGGLMDELISEHIEEHLARPGLSDAERAEAASDVITAIRRYSK